MKISQEKIDSLVRHEALNAMTTLNFALQEANSKEDLNQSLLLDLLAWASYLVAQPESFYGKVPRLFKESIDLTDMVDLIVVLQSKAHEKKIVWSHPEEAFLIWTDKNRTKELLTSLLRFILQASEAVVITIEDQRLTFQHDQKHLNLTKLPPLQVLQVAQMSPFERRLACLLFQAKDLGLKIVGEENVLVVHFETNPS